MPVFWIYCLITELRFSVLVKFMVIQQGDILFKVKRLDRQSELYYQIF